jgi:O-methyltransferase involved in polyketide biosynthesis
VDPQRDYSTISPSAKSLLLVKALTTLPFARQAAEQLWGAPAVEAARLEAASTPGAVARQRHFEMRSRSLDQALEAAGIPRVLEIASGLGFRGLAMAERKDVLYVDSDLPGLASIKAELVQKLHPGPLRGTLRVRALDALDADAFRAAVEEMPAGPVAVVHEGLLMYLDDAEKRRLASSVLEALRRRGGAWITADVYVRSETHLLRDARTTAFLAAHRVEDNKFADFGSARAFFEGCGFRVRETAAPAGDPWSVRQTWTLEAG